MGVNYGGSGGKWGSDNAGIHYTNGYVGIGVNPATQPFEVICYVSGYMAAFRAIFDGGSGAVLRVYKARGTSTAPRRAKNGDTLGGINAFGYQAVDDNTDAVNGVVSGQFLFRATQDYTSTTKGANFKLMVNPTDSVTLTTCLETSHDGSQLHFNIAGIPEYANNAAALAGGLVAGDLYHTPTYQIFIVH